MSQKEDYTEQEWQVLVDVPMLVGAAVMVVGKSGLGTVKESFALAQQTLGALKAYPDSELIQSLLQSRLKDKQKSSIESFSHPMLKLQPSEFKNEVIMRVAEATTTLKTKATDQEFSEYRQWCQQIADKVAHAASEGGVLGFGGTQFSDEEKLAIAEIDKAFTIA